jgi:hypothetical protein
MILASLVLVSLLALSVSLTELTGVRGGLAM